MHKICPFALLALYHRAGDKDAGEQGEGRQGRPARRFGPLIGESHAPRATSSPSEPFHARRVHSGAPPSSRYAQDRTEGAGDSTAGVNLRRSQNVGGAQGPALAIVLPPLGIDRERLLVKDGLHQVAGALIVEDHRRRVDDAAAVFLQKESR